VNVEPEDCGPRGAAAQIVSVDCWISTGSQSGVPVGTLFGFVRSADATIESSLPPIVIAGLARAALT
jgi:hypothetical protein